MTATKAQIAEQAEAIERLRGWIKAGDTVYTVLRHKSASGMSRSIDLYGLTPDAARPGQIAKSWYSYSVAAAGIGSWDDKHEAVRVSGAGMDMGFYLVYALSRVLNPGGFGCIGERCPSNDHSNGDRDYTPHDPARTGMASDNPAAHWHSDGGYALRHEWV